MWTRQYRKSSLRHFAIPAFAVVAGAYFLFHGLHGSLGLSSSRVYEDRIAALSSELAILEKERKILELRTASLRDGTLQRDMIDEQARRRLALVADNEIVVLHGTR